MGVLEFAFAVRPEFAGLRRAVVGADLIIFIVTDPVRRTAGRGKDAVHSGIIFEFAVAAFDLGLTRRQPVIIFVGVHMQSQTDLFKVR